ncbi:two-component sensor histidine kinase [Bacillus aerolatus]|uniref:histidine kinase n=1 Tax=Bacillus aerolatus TaxID=2653354 RepID=A0A6I1FN78_9BACI|nr:ATP-binding protein [Bacillus aerolatus]KAB7707876.1 two-component sensor histidine kinase [Bacillus aerolatus]
MNKRERSIYFFIVVLPAILSIIGCYQFLSDRAGEQQHEKLEWVATIHRNQMDQFINETKVSMDILAVSTEEELQNLNKARTMKIQTMLKKMAGKDPRYGGIYVLDFEGNLLVGTNDLLKQYNLRDKPYITEALLTKDTAVSDEAETLSNNQPVIAIATPVMNDEHVEAILVSHIRLDYMKNIMRMLTPEHSISIENAKQIPIFSVNEKLETDKTEQIVKYPLAQLPWNLVISTYESNKSNLFPLTLMFGAAIIILLHIVFLLVKYVMLKRQTKLEKMQQEAQKLELIGTLAASTAHEIRNPLTGIKGLVQLLNEKYDNTEDKLYFAVINKEIERINQIVSEFLILGKPTAQRVQTVDIREIIFDLNPLIRSEANLYGIEYNLTLPEQEVWVQLNVDQMKQVLLNLTKNAFEAMPKEGQLSVMILKGEEDCHITIADTGSGIKKEDLDLIFKPFFTSKEDGTGLGLVVCKRIIESFGGMIEIESELGFGAVVNITLPLQKHQQVE